MACKFMLQPLRRYNIKHSKMHNFTLDMLWLEKTKENGQCAKLHPLDLCLLLCISQ